MDVEDKLNAVGMEEGDKQLVEEGMQMVDMMDNEMCRLQVVAHKKLQMLEVVVSTWMNGAQVLHMVEQKE